MNKKTILVVDDDIDIVEAISIKLEASNYRVVKAYDGEEAWDKIKEESPDALILDVIMPKKDGYTLCNEIKKSSVYKNIVVILLTSVVEHLSSTKFTHTDGKNNLADDFIPKPIELDKLINIVDENLK